MKENREDLGGRNRQRVARPKRQGLRRQQRDFTASIFNGQLLPVPSCVKKYAAAVFAREQIWKQKEWQKEQKDRMIEKGETK